MGITVVCKRVSWPEHTIGQQLDCNHRITDFVCCDWLL